MHESSAYSSKSDLEACFKSFMDKRNSKGPKMEHHSSNLLHLKMIYLTVCLEKPMCSILFKRNVWFIVSNAFCKSIKTIPVSNPQSKPVRILSVKKDKQKFVEW